MVGVSNPQNYTNIKFLFYVLLRFNSVAQQPTRNAVVLFTSCLFYCVTHKNTLNYKHSYFLKIQQSNPCLQHFSSLSLTRL